MPVTNRTTPLDTISTYSVASPTKAPEVMAESAISGGPGLAVIDIKKAIIGTDRSRKPFGTLTLARHTALNPKWIDP